MLDHKDYLETLNKARRKRNRRWDPRYLLMILGAVVLIGIVAALAMSLKKPASGRAAGEPGQEAGPGPGATPAQAAEPTLSQEEKERQEQQAAIDEVVNSYQNLGLVQVSGYLNIRETPSLDGKIIGKLSGDAGCEILETDGEWSHITSGGVDGYINNQYLLTGDEAKSKAKELVKLRAIVTTDNLNIRKEPALDPNNVIGQALLNERYVVLGQQDGWIQIEEGYISADYAEVKYALNEGRKMDLKAMAINQYDNLVISKVNNYLNVRAEPKSDGKIIGKMTSKAAGEILESLDGWYKIKSGPITGYITADPQYTATGQEAKDIAMQTATLRAVINTDVLNVRTEPNTDAKIWTQIVKDERYPVLAQLDGWVQIELDSVDEEDGSEGDKAYISTRDNNVEVRYALNEAIKFSPAEEAANAAASRRSKVVNYALQFVGNPYVWGGTSLTNGADCSGFTQAVYAHFGITTGRSSRDQAARGKEIPVDEAQPGDLLFYASGSYINHVAMYIGGGQVIHASNPKTGICISPSNYRTPCKAVTFLD